uniref:F-box associated beta-propeller type 3 domain-containing protein n=1 Tax=Chenopodium quinoa TaxID=63459 RepID=A0A803LER1_CHEQI
MADLEAKSDSKKSKNNPSETLTLSLPDHILIEEILARLPVESLIRFKSVSYNECSSVKDLVGLGCGGIEVFPILVGSCNGLLCLCDKEEYAGKFIVWNPATDDYREITNPNNIPDVLAYGFGYDTSNDDYKIAAAFGTRTRKFRGFYVFSLRDGEWKRIVGKFNRRELPIAVRLGDEALLIDDTLYWPPRLVQCYDQYFKAKHIVGFDLISEKFKEIPWPDDSCWCSKVDLYRFKGHLTYRGSKGNNSRDIWDFWMLKYVDKTGTWEKLFTVDLTNVLFYNFSKTDKCLVRQFEQLKLIDPCKEALEQVRGDKKYSHMATTGDYVESLVSPFATTKIDEEDGNYEVTLQTAIQPIMDSIHRKILLNKGVPMPQIQMKNSDHEDDSDNDCYDGSESDLEDDDGCESDFEDDDDDDGRESDLEDDGNGSDLEDDGNGSDLEDDGSGSHLEDGGKVNKYWLSSGDSDKDSDYFKSPVVFLGWPASLG